MNKYTLKKNQPAFEVVDGPMARQKFTHNVTYSQLPNGYEKRFEAVKERPNAGTLKSLNVQTPKRPNA